MAKEGAAEQTAVAPEPNPSLAWVIVNVILLIAQLGMLGVPFKVPHAPATTDR